MLLNTFKPKLFGSIIVTYRCNAKCNMCGVWKLHSSPSDEIDCEIIQKLPHMHFTNVTGGEPFVRTDLPDIIAELRKKSDRIVISTNGFFTERIIKLCKLYPDVGIRISVEGFLQTNDRIRGIPDGYNRTQRTLKELQEIGIRDIGFAMTIQDTNCKELTGLYRLAHSMGYEFATSAIHNSHYFNKWDNRINEKSTVIEELRRLIIELLKSNNPKEWFRAYFNYGLINYINGQERLLPCDMGREGFFLDPSGNVLACNGMDQKQPMGNLREQSWESIWHGKRAEEVRSLVCKCNKNCWMIGSAAPAMLAHPIKPIIWVIINKLKLIFGKDIALCPKKE